ncbi:hypothetical protein [Flavobacterium terrigena]|uniref:Uncharacterized protein n=1 Tax=Flavobacterium terrigena TaxID=402734 RepID=A0A1H6ULU5_9FLAO|nr:hypothetical protein [Flavobacterium terrigena]SEI93269.1 hypothetical protein SAMN05660918_1961 [Flavobacterium terrigena]
MTNFLVIRGTADGGKTTTAGLLFEQLKPKASQFKLFNWAWKEIDKLHYNSEGELIDFIAVLVIDGKVIIIISQGDKPNVLQKVLDFLKDLISLSKITGINISKIDIVICCARSRNVNGSTYKMLTKRINSNNLFDFWTSKDDDISKKLSCKQKVVDELVQKIKSL